MCGLHLKYGEFSREEDEELIENWREYANYHHISVREAPMYFGLKRQDPVDRKEIIQRARVTKLRPWMCKHLLHRSCQMVIRRCRELFHPRNRMGSDKEPWTDEEIESLVRFVKELGPNYKEIGLRLNRSYRACLNRYRIICKHNEHLKVETSQSSKRYGPGLAWPEEDLVRLQQLVNRFGPRWKVISLCIDRSLYAVRSFAFKFIQWEKRKYSERLPYFLRESSGCDPQQLVSEGNLVEQEARICWYDASQRTGKSATECRVKWDDFKELIRLGIEEDLGKGEILSRLMEATAPLPQPEAQERRLFTVGESLDLLRLVQEKGPQWVEIGRELIREDFMKLSIFGGQGVEEYASKQYSNTRLLKVDTARRTFNWFCTRVGLPEGFVTPRSARQGYCFSKCFAYISAETTPTYEECIKKARGLREWTTKASEAYLRPSELPIEELITTVMDQRRQYPNRAINAYDEYMTVSKIVRLPDVQGPGDIDRRAIEALGKLAEESHFKRLKSVAAGLAAECEHLKQFGRPADDPELQKLLNQWGGEGLTEAEHDGKLRKTAAKFAGEAKRKATNLIKTDHIRRAMHGSIKLPTLPPLTPKVLDVVATSQLLASRTHCRWSMTPFAVTYPLNYNQLCPCPFYMCGYRFRQADGPHGIVAHMNDAHFRPDEDLPTCRKHPNIAIQSVDDWLSHWNDYHRYILCFDCAKGDEFETLGTFSRGHVIGTLCFTEAQPHKIRGRPYAQHQSESDDMHTSARAMDGVRWIYADPAPYECGCHQSSCPYNDNPLLHPLLQHEEYLAAGAVTISSAGQGASRWMKRKWFLMMAREMLVGKPYTEDEIERCADYYFNAQYPLVMHSSNFSFIANCRPGREMSQPASSLLRAVRDVQDQQKGEHACQVHYRYLKLGRVRIAPLFAGRWNSEELRNFYNYLKNVLEWHPVEAAVRGERYKKVNWSEASEHAGKTSEQCKRKWMQMRTYFKWSAEVLRKPDVDKIAEHTLRHCVTEANEEALASFYVEHTGTERAPDEKEPYSTMSSGQLSRCINMMLKSGHIERKQDLIADVLRKSLIGSSDSELATLIPSQADRIAGHIRRMLRRCKKSGVLRRLPSDRNTLRDKLQFLSFVLARCDELLIPTLRFRKLVKRFAKRNGWSLLPKDYSSEEPGDIDLRMPHA
ncbi:hypothetical protein AAVH_08133 [Aphelenchoides avenae]|nr:hypothetical protein AAVH_08133 [Aphelenchus avenae]